MIYTFNTSVEGKARQKLDASQDKVEVKNFNIIYEFIDDLKEELQQRIPPQKERDVIGQKYSEYLVMECA